MTVVILAHAVSLVTAVAPNHAVVVRGERGDEGVGSAVTMTAVVAAAALNRAAAAVLNLVVVIMSPAVAVQVCVQDALHVPCAAHRGRCVYLRHILR